MVPKAPSPSTARHICDNDPLSTATDSLVQFVPILRLPLLLARLDFMPPAVDRPRRFYRRRVAFIIAAIIIRTFGRDYPIGEVGDWRNKSGDNKQEERVYPRAPIKRNVRALWTEQKPEGKGAKDIRDG
ncbi:unnamed protein product [Fusarium graminearum]|uniref:Uncharacterized protein n=1 Tax=Gibberella zeae TaxID=5518 RepID=A0A9N8NBK5_GIBZA|nr:unnamed protein product [Fusarium graminearum]